MNWLFLKGLARGQVHWDRQPDVFEKRVPGARVHKLDLPGIGEAFERPAPWKVATIVDDMRERFLELREAAPGDDERPWSILGISLGGMILMEWISRYPTDFQRGVSLVSSAANVSPPWKRLMPSIGPQYIRALLAKELVDRERYSLRVVTNDRTRLEEIVKAHIEVGAKCPITVRVVYRQLLAATKWSAPNALPIPVLFLGSHADRMVDPSCTPGLAARFASPLRMHTTSGHEIPHDDPFWVADQVADWLKSF